MRAFFIDMLGLQRPGSGPGLRHARDRHRLLSQLHPQRAERRPGADAAHHRRSSAAQERRLPRSVHHARYLPDPGARGALWRAAAALAGARRRGALGALSLRRRCSLRRASSRRSSFLSLHSHPGRSSPTRRGKALREIFLCQKVPAAAGQRRLQSGAEHQRSALQDGAPAPDGASQRADVRRLPQDHGSRSGSRSRTSTPPGEYRSTENGAPIDASGELSGKSFDGDQAAGADHPRRSGDHLLPAQSRLLLRHRAQADAAGAGVARPACRPSCPRTGVRWRELMRRITLNPDFYTIPRAQRRCRLRLRIDRIDARHRWRPETK